MRQNTERIELSSEAIASAGYEPERRTLDVEFTSGAVYRYSDVPPAVRSHRVSS